MLLLPPSVTGRAGIIILLPVPFLYASQASFYLELLSGVGIGDIAASDDLWVNLQSLINLHPRGDRQDYFGFRLPDSYLGLKELVQQLRSLNEAQPLPGRKQQQPMTADKVPPKSSGDSYADLLADLAQSYGVDGAIQLMEKCSLDQLNHVIFRANELTRDPEERTKEVMEDAHARWIEQNQDIFNASLGIL